MLVALPGLAGATDLGSIGPVYPIGEPHLLDFIRAQLVDKQRSGALRALEQQAKQRGIATVTQPLPVPGVTATATARTFFVDPTLTLARNVIDDKGALLFAAGTRKNPLAVVSLSTPLLFFDARDIRQVAQARTLLQRAHGRIKPVLVGGAYLDLMRAWRTRVYYDQQGRLTQRLGITHVPALVSQEGLRLRIDELEIP